jgi:dTDP-4-dehydrorhamnose 3,5-epimerase-like enzyme
MHFQADPHPEGKLVRCTRGAIWDVVIDLRSGSPSYRQWIVSDTDRRLRGAISHERVLLPRARARCALERPRFRH